MKLSEILNQKNYIVESAQKLGFVNPRIVRLDDDNTFNLLLDVGPNNENAYNENHGLLIAKLKKHFNCEIDILIDELLKDLYQASIHKNTVDLYNIEKLHELFGVSSLDQIDFPTLQLTEDEQENLVWLANRADEKCKGMDVSETPAASQSSLQFYPHITSNPTQTPLISEEKRKRLFEFLDREEISAEALAGVAEEYKRRKSESPTVLRAY